MPIYSPFRAAVARLIDSHLHNDTLTLLASFTSPLLPPITDYVYVHSFMELKICSKFGFLVYSNLSACHSLLAVEKIK